MEDMNGTALTLTEHPAEDGSSEWEVSLLTVVVAYAGYLLLVNLNYSIRQNDRLLRTTNILCCTVSMLVLLQASLLYVRMQVGNLRSQALCLADTVAQKLLSCSTRTLMYMVYWLRQNSFHRSNRFAALMPSHFSKAMRVIIFLLSAIYMGGYIAYWFLTQRNACSSGWKIDSSLAAIRGLLIPIFTAIACFQLCLLLPVLIPVWRQCIVGHRNAHHHSSLKFNTDLKWVMVRLCLCAFAFLMTDAAMITLMAISPEIFVLMPALLPTLYCLGTNLQLTAIMMSFKNYVDRIVPCCLVCKCKESLGEGTLRPEAGTVETHLL